ncbi:hypothetical protein QVD17_29918 [Tagetes erecta]|uniref:Protein kinase domain-containing protein n=1 Tax=Tagetes erecta TaxID=13708 RepID=A0AAD8K4L7_TARER|nr:hypothetical protein QVD17_29918 [Tagetes erecta]
MYTAFFSSLESPRLCHQFTFSEIQSATQNFDESLVIGHGGFGNVYKGTISNGENLLTVAVKRLDSNSNQGALEFWAEVNMLSNLRHRHLVSLIGYCNDKQEMILVYEYMSYGTLEYHLHNSQVPLSWMQRLKICVGAARGLDYLHTDTCIKDRVVHRDIKSSNILLHDSWDAKISDFGLSKICPKNQQSTYVNTIVKGTFGYLDPNYFYTGKLTRKSDVYAFGVVLFEILCGKRAVDRGIDEEQWALAIWAKDSIKAGRLKQIVDINIRGSVSLKCLKMFVKLAKQCLHTYPKERPTMTEVVGGLEGVMALQEKLINNRLQATTLNLFAIKARKFMYTSNDKNYEGSSLNSLEMYFDTLRGENQTLQCFDLDTLIAATENFSEANKISPHTSKPLYKGKLHDGQSIAVTSHSLGSRLEEACMNEASILENLEHENVSKLLGYCIEGRKWFLVYDFAVYASLDCLMFDPECTLLNWDKRYKIILGVARALHYLHRETPVQVIHCDVKPENILLDGSLKPKLSSFGNARCQAINETDCCMSSISGTWVYMAPELVERGHLSTKVDVYSLGVLVLEIITGHKATMNERMNDISLDYKSCYYNSLLEYVEINWLEGTLTDIIDPRIDVDSSSMTAFLEIGLFCIQEYSEARPTMAEVVSMLLDSLPPALQVAKMRQMIIKKRSNSTIHRFDNHNHKLMVTTMVMVLTTTITILMHLKSLYQNYTIDSAYLKDFKLYQVTIYCVNHTTKLPWTVAV